MWKYIGKKETNEFLLSLNLIDKETNDIKELKELYNISNNIEKYYKVFKIPKRNGSFRTIYAPSKTLKIIERNILKNILNNKSISKYAKAYHKGITLIDNASPHINKEIVLKLDIKNFFDNIDFLKVYNSCFSIEYFPASVGMILTYLCTYNDFLPQGSPASAYISNLIMKDFDEELGAFCNKLNISYTRYSDDLTFSGLFDVSNLILVVKKMLSKMNFELNKEKIHVIRNNNKQNVTGVIVNKKLRVDNSYRKSIRQEMYYINKFGLTSHLLKINYQHKPSIYINNLLGRILFVLQINNEDKEFIKYKKEVLKLKKCTF
ncbi:MAG: reverse transcriptase family protein [Bacilli bacterium]